jgi:antitoxin PrlF
MKAIVAERGQVTIPKALRDKLGIMPGTALDFHAENDRLVAQKILLSDPVSLVFGCLVSHKTSDQLLDELRGQIDNGD